MTIFSWFQRPFRGFLARKKQDVKSESQYTTTPLFPAGPELLHDCQNANIDICFIHGLTGDRDSTWTAKGELKPWPETLLPTKLSNARILTYGYDAYIWRSTVASGNGLLEHASNLLHDLSTYRASSNASSRPIIFVVHSLGGLVCKEAILLSRDSPDSHYQDIFRCTRGIAFLGTPHRGSWIARWGKISASSIGLFISTNKSLLQVLQTDDKHLQLLQNRFLSMVRERDKSGRSLEIACFIEELPLRGVGKVVSPDSATLEGYNPISIHANHSNMSKFASVEDNGFKRLVGVLDHWNSEVTKLTTSEPTNRAREAQIRTPTNFLFDHNGNGDQMNAPGGTINRSSGDGNHFPGATFSGAVHLG